MEIVGAILVPACIIIAFWWVVKQKRDKMLVVTLAILGVFAGFVFFFQERITELTLEGVGTIKTAAQKAVSDAEDIAQLKERVENQSATVDLVASEASKAIRLSEEIADKNQNAEEKLKTLSSNAEKANKIMDELGAISELTTTVTKAKNDDRWAFFKLWDLANEPGPFKSIAYQVVEQVLQEIDPVVNLRVDPDVPWEKMGVVPGVSPLAKLKSVYPPFLLKYRPRFISDVWRQDGYSLGDRLGFLSEIMRTEDSLRALHRACYLMNTEAKLNKNVLGADLYLEWWENHRNNYATD